MMEMKKILALGIILLFIGVAIAPSINFTVVKASNDNDLVEVTTQACGIKGFGNTTVKLTKQQYQNLEQYLVEFRARLNQTSTREEAVPIFKDAVVELDKYGLLPKGMSVKTAQKLVIGPSYDFMYKNLMKKAPKNNTLNGIYNYFCLVVGNTSQTYPLNIFNFLPYILFDTYIHFLPFRLLSPVVFGHTWWFIPEGGAMHVPSQGWISAIGLFGLTERTGSFFGALYAFNVEAFNIETRYRLGMNIFSGITFIHEGSRFILGFTPHLALNDYTP